MVIAGIEKNNTPLLDTVLSIFTEEDTLPILNKSNSIVLMEMVWERLHNSLKTTGFYPQLIVIDYRSDFFLHGHSPLANDILPQFFTKSL